MVLVMIEWQRSRESEFLKILNVTVGPEEPISIRQLALTMIKNFPF